MSAAIQPLPPPEELETAPAVRRISRLTDYAILLKLRVTSLVVMTAWTGYFLGAHYSQRIPQKSVRQIITAVGFIISAVMFYKQFR